VSAMDTVTGTTITAETRHVGARGCASMIRGRL
jgi:hypothetical protein